MPRRRIQANLESVQFDRGHDGFLRGKPEPVLLFAAYGVNAFGVGLLTFTRYILQVKKPFPTTVETDGVKLFRAPVPDGTRSLILFALALEFDKGPDIISLTRGLEDPNAWGVWATDSPVSVPFTFPDLALLKPFRPPAAMSSHVKYLGKDIRTFCKKDDYVGAAVILIGAQRSSQDTWQMRFLSQDKKNDWTALVRLHL